MADEGIKALNRAAEDAVKTATPIFVNAVKENTKSDEVLALVQTDERVIEALGEPIESTSIGSYNISFRDGERSANAIIPIKGPNGNGEIYVTTSGEKEDPVYEKLQVYIEEDDRIIDLMDAIDSGLEDF